MQKQARALLTKTKEQEEQLATCKEELKHTNEERASLRKELNTAQKQITKMKNEVEKDQEAHNQLNKVTHNFLSNSMLSYKNSDKDRLSFINSLH